MENKEYERVRDGLYFNLTDMLSRLAVILDIKIGSSSAIRKLKEDTTTQMFKDNPELLIRADDQSLPKLKVNSRYPVTYEKRNAICRAAQQDMLKPDKDGVWVKCRVIPKEAKEEVNDGE